MISSNVITAWLFKGHYRREHAAPSLPVNQNQLYLFSSELALLSSVVLNQDIQMWDRTRTPRPGGRSHARTRRFPGVPASFGARRVLSQSLRHHLITSSAFCIGRFHPENLLSLAGSL